MKQPPAMLGIIFLLYGIGLSFATPDAGKPNWIMYAAGAVFFSGGLMVLLSRLENKVYVRIAGIIFLAPFLAIFHWVAFGVGERIGNDGFLFSEHQGVNVKSPFMVFTVFLDFVLAGGLIYWLINRRKN